jgi:hypothetical protein
MINAISCMNGQYFVMLILEGSEESMQHKVNVIRKIALVTG